MGLEDETLETAQSAQAVHDAERLLANLVSAVNTGDPQQITTTLKELSQVADHIQGSEVEKMLPGLVQQARVLVADPKNKQAKVS